MGSGRRKWWTEDGALTGKNSEIKIKEQKGKSMSPEQSPMEERKTEERGLLARRFGLERA